MWSFVSKFFFFCWLHVLSLRNTGALALLLKLFWWRRLQLHTDGNIDKTCIHHSAEDLHIMSHLHLTDISQTFLFLLVNIHKPICFSHIAQEGLWRKLSVSALACMLCLNVLFEQYVPLSGLGPPVGKLPLCVRVTVRVLSLQWVRGFHWPACCSDGLWMLRAVGICVSQRELWQYEKCPMLLPVPKPHYLASRFPRAEAKDGDLEEKRDSITSQLFLHVSAQVQQMRKLSVKIWNKSALMPW